MALFEWLFSKPTPDEELIRQLKAAVEEVTRLSKQARRRGISVWLPDNFLSGGKIIHPEYLTWDRAYKRHEEKIG